MPVCVAGMHRSGTSMVTKLLRDAGLFLGPDAAIMPAAEENPEGFWEHVGFVELNEEILNRLGGGWDCPPPVPADWAAGPLAPLRPRAASLLEPFAGREPWGWKDPRTSLTLPFWQPLLPGLRIVVVVRNPLEVALSLRQRNGFSFALGLTLWQIYHRRLLDDAAPGDRIVTHYDAYFGEPESEIHRLLDFLDLPVDDAVVAHLRSGASSGLRHHRLTLQDLLDAGVSGEVVALYRALCHEAGWRDTDGSRIEPVAPPTDYGPDGDVSVAPLEIGVGGLQRSTVELMVLRRELDEHRRALAGRVARVEELEGALQAHELDRAALDARVVELDRWADSRDNAIRERDAAAEARDAAVRERDQARERIAELEAAIRRRDEARERAMAERDDVEREVMVLRQTVGDQAQHLDALTVRLEALASHEDHLRGLLVGAHDQLLRRDAEVLASLGAALVPHAPAAPAAVAYRGLIERIRDAVAANLPAGAPVLVAGSGDDAVLRLDGRPAWSFPRSPGGPLADFASVDGAAAVTQLEMLRATRGVRFLVVPDPALAWLARQPELERYLADNCPVVVREEGTCVIYDLGSIGGEGPA